jgi:hypothetical protein
MHPYDFCKSEVLPLFDGVKALRIEDREHGIPGSRQWHVLTERR